MKIFTTLIITVFILIGCKNEQKEDFSEYHYDIQGVWSLVKAKPSGESDYTYSPQGRESVVTENKIIRHNSDNEHTYRILKKGTLFTDDSLMGDTMHFSVHGNEATWIFQNGTIWKLTRR